MNFRKSVGAVALFVLLPISFPVFSESVADFPSRPIKLVVPFSPGGPGDSLARLVAERLRKAWNQPVVIDPKPGAAQQIGTAFVANAAPDGYTIGLVTMAHITNPSWSEVPLPYDAIRDLRGVTQLVELQIAILARTGLPANNLPELIALSKKQQGQLSFGTVPGSGGHLAGELLNNITGAGLRFIPYKGAQDVKKDLIPGRLDLSFDPLTAADMQLVKSGHLKAIALAGANKSRLAPEIPRAVDSVPGFSASGMMGLVVPKDTPTPIVQKIYAELAKAMETGDLGPAIHNLFMEPVISTPEEFDFRIKSETRKWSEVVKKIRSSTPKDQTAPK